MVATNVQAFSGDVEISSNLAVDTNTLFVDSVGNKVGIGTTDPTGQLEVHGEGQTSFTSFNQDGNMGGALALRSDDGIAGSGGAVMFGSHAGFHAAIKASLIDGSNNTTGDLNFFVRSDHPDATMSQKMVIKNNGRVGIGKTDPGATLDVRGSASDPSAPTVHIGDNVTDQGDYGMVNLVRHPTDGGSKAHLAFVRNGNTVFGQGFYNNTNTFGFWPSFGAVTNTPTMCFDPSGNVGIGKTDPSCTLDINDSTSQYNGIFSNRLWVASVGDNTGDGSPDDNTGSPWRGLGFDDLAWNDQSYKYSGDIPILSGYEGVALRSGAGNIVLTQAGDVGIGVTDPVARLHVQTPVGTASNFIRVESSMNDGSSQSISGVEFKTNPQFFNGDNSQRVPARIDSGFYNGAAGTTNWADAYISLLTTNDPASGVLYDALTCRGGGVGIGVTSPNTKLDVNGSMQSYSGRHVKMVPIRAHGYNDIASNGGTIVIANAENGSGSTYQGSFAAFNFFGGSAINNFTGERWVTPNRVRICFRWGFVGGYVANVTWKFWERYYPSTSPDILKGTHTSSNGSLSRGFTTVWGPTMSITYNDVPVIFIEADSNNTAVADATVRVSSIWLEYLYD